MNFFFVALKNPAPKVSYAKRIDEKALGARQRLKKILEKKSSNNKSDAKADGCGGSAKAEERIQGLENKENNDVGSGTDDVELTTVDVVVKTNQGQGECRSHRLIVLFELTEEGLLVELLQTYFISCVGSG